MWYVIQVMTGEEKNVAGKLRDSGIRASVPAENRPIRSGGVWRKKEYILFTGYVFLEMPFNADNYYKVRRIPGVIRFLGDNASPSTLSYLEAEWIRLLSGRNGRPLEPTVVRENGDGKLQIVSGVLASLEHNIVKWDKRSRKAVFEITVCGEKKTAQLGIALEGEELTAEADGDGAQDGAQSTLQAMLKEAT